LAPLAAQLKERLWIATSCSLLHVPYSAKTETNLADGAEHWLAFAEEKLAEGRLLANAIDDAKVLLGRDWLAQAERVTSRQQSKRVHKAAVKARAIEAASRQWQRELPYAQRLARQQAQLNLPDFPTTTIGSFPQTDAIRSLRKRFKKGDITVEDYECGLKLEIEYCIKAQENIGLDVLVHGEAERNDMVEYFGELLEGIAVSANGWVQSYGSRCVKPPIIYGDIERLQAMTVRWSQYAQSLSAKPVKGMLTGPITLLKWAFVRDDQSWESTAYQLAAVLQDEVLDLECAGISIIQIDEPALREALPLRRDQHQTYLNWAVNSFRYTYAGVAAETQIHTHMCYADFDDILTAIQAMDADVITLETARSANKLLQTLKREPYHNGIGPGVYDIHSPNVPDIAAMSEILQDSLNVVPAHNLWVNPDCGLKTRRWEEVTPALKAMVSAAQALRVQS
jgi:5-methyltetrahydropteroyltriglutamate--homocysteine methyltransferase